MPYNPVTFDVIPVQTYNDRANPPAAQALQAPVIDGNFAKLNAELGKQPAYSSSTFRSFGSPLTTFSSPTNWVNFPASNWPALSFTVPDWATVVHVAIGASAYNNVSTLSSMWIDAAISGSAVLKSGLTLRTLYRYNGGYWSSTSLWRVGVDVKANATLTLQPRYNLSAYTAGKAGCSRTMLCAMALM
jgi:hypothetical protein